MIEDLLPQLLQNSAHISSIALAVMFWRVDRRLVRFEAEFKAMEKELHEHKTVFHRIGKKK